MNNVPIITVEQVENIIIRILLEEDKNKKEIIQKLLQEK